MPWPADDEYARALQNPQYAFTDCELQQGKIEKNRKGQPRPRSGANATVYRSDCGSMVWAVRCFTREVRDQQQRYAAINAHLQKNPLPYCVQFHYLPDGIRVESSAKAFPILKMEWVEGKSLHAYVRDALAARTPGVLGRLAERWIEMLRALRAIAMAHGDLQHDNVKILANGDIKLIDYDGVYVPTLQGRMSLETGHRNYQHPRRDSSHYGPELDSFAGWVIYLSLVALDADPSLWRFNAQDPDRLILGDKDFKNWSQSPALQALLNASDARTRELVGEFQRAMRYSLDAMPSPVDASMAARQRGGPAGSASAPAAAQPLRFSGPVSTPPVGSAAAVVGRSGLTSPTQTWTSVQPPAGPSSQTGPALQPLSPAPSGSRSRYNRLVAVCITAIVIIIGARAAVRSRLMGATKAAPGREAGSAVANNSSQLDGSLPPSHGNDTGRSPPPHEALSSGLRASGPGRTRKPVLPNRSVDLPRALHLDRAGKVHSSANTVGQAPASILKKAPMKPAAPPSAPEKKSKSEYFKASGVWD